MRDTGTAVLSNLSRVIEGRVDVKLCLRDIGVDNTYMLSNTKALLGHTGTCIHCHVGSIIDSGEAYTTRHLAIGGKELLELGYRGKEVGDVLEFLLTSVINGDLANEREQLLNTAKLYTPHV